MSKLTFPNLKFLVSDMNKQGADKEHFCFTYSHCDIDCIFSIGHKHHELLVAIIDENYGFVVNVYINRKGDFVAEIDEESYFGFCKVARLTYKDNHFTSSALLNLLSVHIPKSYSGWRYTDRDMRPYLCCRKIDEAEKIYFKGWNDHTKDKNTARNFDKTEFYFGKQVADYCRSNNISSIWSANPNDESSEKNHPPWCQ